MADELDLALLESDAIHVLDVVKAGKVCVCSVCARARNAVPELMYLLDGHRYNLNAIADAIECVLVTADDFASARALLRALRLNVLRAIPWGERTPCSSNDPEHLSLRVIPPKHREAST